MIRPKALQSLKRLVKRRVFATAPIVLMYHRVAEAAVDPWGLAVHPARFDEQIDALTRSRRVVHLHELVDEEQRRSSSDRPLAAVTFDDGYHDVYQNARGVLQRHDCPMTLFVTTGMIGAAGEFWWDSLCRIFLETESLPATLSLELSAGKTHHWSVPAFDKPGERNDLLHEIWAGLRPQPHDKIMTRVEELARWSGCSLAARESHRVMTADEVRDISDGLIRIGAHTVTHPTLPAHRYEDQYREIAQSRRACEELIDGPVDAFAYPFGDHDASTVAAVREAGFSWACTVNAGVVRAATDHVRLPRLYVGNWDGDEFQRRLAEDAFP